MNNDKSNYKAVADAMRVIGFSPEEVDSVHRILATILHLVSHGVAWPWPHPRDRCPALCWLRGLCGVLASKPCG